MITNELADQKIREARHALERLPTTHPKYQTYGAWCCYSDKGNAVLEKLADDLRETLAMRIKHGNVRYHMWQLHICHFLADYQIISAIKENQNEGMTDTVVRECVQMFAKRCLGWMSTYVSHSQMDDILDCAWRWVQALKYDTPETSAKLRDAQDKLRKYSE